VSSAESGLRLGVAVYSPEGVRRAAAGPLATVPVRLPESVMRRTDSEIIERRDLGRSYTWRVVTQRSPAAIVQVAVYARRFERNVRYVRRIFIVALPTVLIATAGIGWWLARSSLRPIARMTAAARRISGAHLDERIPRSGTGDQLDQLAETLDDMTARLRESVLRMRRFAGDAAHELRTPLAALRSRIEVTLLREPSPGEMKDTLISARDEVDRLAETVSAMLRLARSEAGIDPARRSDVALAPLLRDVVGFFEPVAEDGGVQLRAGDLPDVTVPGDAEWLHQLFANLVHNAVRYTPAGGEVMVEGWCEPRGTGARIAVSQRLREDSGAVAHDAAPADVAAARCVVIRVRDTGIGIAPADHSRIFERFYRGSAAASRGGTGLGLPIAREIARAHGGDITVASTEGNGATFVVRLPCES
jgi:signal transduction histidine kinase